MKYRLHPEARADLRDAASYYREQASPALARAFLSEVEKVFSLLCLHPGLGSPWRFGKRRFVLRRFPYSIIYRVAEDQIRVLAVAHHSRRPGFWRDWR